MAKVVRFFEAYKGRLPDRIDQVPEPELSSIAKRVLVRLGRFEGRRGEARPRLETLAECLGISRESAKRAVGALRDAGLIHVTARHHEGRPSLYEFLDHPWLHEAPTIEAEDADDELPPAPRPSKPKRAPKPKAAQPELPGVPPPPPPPPKEKSSEMLIYDLFMKKRRDKLGELFTEEKIPPHAAWVTAVFSSVLKAVEDDEDDVVDLLRLYFDEDWPAAYGPYSFACFAKHWREKWLPKVREVAAA